MKEQNKLSNAPIVMAEDYWANTHFSIARYYGQIKVFGYVYVIVNKHGVTIFELSDEKSEHFVGKGNKAIEPGEPADLCRTDWVPIYRALGREAFIEYIREQRTLQEATIYVKQLKSKGT